MAYCPNCGGQVKDEHHYCGKCGNQLTEMDEADQIPPSGTPSSHRGFLSGRSTQYLVEVLHGERGLDPETVAYSNLSRDVGAGLADLAKVALVSDINLLALVLDNSNSAEALGEDLEHLDQRQMEERMMWAGLIQTPKIYDRTFGTNWSEEFSEELDLLLKKAETRQSEESQ